MAEEKNPVTSPDSLEQETPFYNVMPKEAKGPLVGPKIQVSEVQETQTGEANPMWQFVQNHKLPIAAMLAILILAYPAWYFLNKYVLNPEGNDALLTWEALKKLEQKKPSPNGEETPLAYTTTAKWQSQYFKSEKCENLDQCGDEADPDRDGAKNLEEFQKETDPNNADSDQDGLADGDELHIFGSDPLNKYTAGDTNYNDGQYIKGGYNPKTKDALFSPSEINDVSLKMKQFGLHAPTPQTLNDALFSIYKFAGETAPNPQSSQTATSATSTPAGVDQSPQSKQDRDTQRNNTIKNIGIALLKYFDGKGSYPSTTNFSEMFSGVKPYTKVATNPTDPINKEPYVYAYAPSPDNKDFFLSFFSESQNQLIRVRAADAKKYKDQEQAALYDDQRKNNLDTLRSALLLYSAENTDGNRQYVFPTPEAYQTALVPKFISEIPKDPKTGAAYEYKVSENFDSFTLKAVLDGPATGTTGYLCNQEECRAY